MITTSANRVKQGIYWCEEADNTVTEALKGTEYNWDSEIPITWILDHGNLPDGLLTLGAVRPRFQPKANAVLLNYVRRIYEEARKLIIDSIEIKSALQNVAHWIDNPDRVQASKLEYAAWQKERRSASDPYAIRLYEVMLLLFSEQPLVLKAIHTTKLYLGAYAMKYGFKESDIVKRELKEYLRKQVELF